MLKHSKKLKAINTTLNSGKVKIGLIGYGYWGKNLARNLEAHPEVEFSFICDKNPTSFSCNMVSYPRLCYDYRAAIESMKPNAVLIATPIETHFAVARDCIEKGIHVLVQKPLADTSKKVNFLDYHAQRQGVVVMTAHTFLFNECIKKIKGIIDVGELGGILHIDSVRKNLGLFSRTHSVLWDLAPHDFSIITHLLNGEMPLSVSAMGFSHKNFEQEDSVNISLQYRNKRSACISLSWFSPTKQRMFTVCGEDKMIVYDDCSAGEKVKVVEKSVSYDKDLFSYRTGNIFSPKINETEAIYNEISHFVECIRNPEKICISGVELSRKVVRLIECAETSIKNKGTPELLS